MMRPVPALDRSQARKRLPVWTMPSPARPRPLAALGRTALLLAGLAAPIPSFAEDFPAQRGQVLKLGGLTTPPPTYHAEGVSNEGGLRAIFYDVLPWHGRPTRAFAWLGIPEKHEGKLPGVVLVHGGGGTAFKTWVQKWNERGYAAISIAVEGQTDEPDPSAPAARRAWKRHEWAGPKRDGIYGDSAEPLSEQWMYHAVADTVLANSLIRSIPEVDAGKVGVMGVSWGGVITSTVIGIDSRFAFAIPTYGCGHLFDSDNQYGRALGASRHYREVWDPLLYMSRAKMPALWLSWPEDKHFPLDCQAICYRAAPGPHMVSLIPGMGHSHEAASRPPDGYAFAESVVRDGKPWCRQETACLRDGMAEVTFTSSKPLDHAVLVTTPDTGFTGDRKWSQSPAAMEKRNDVWTIIAPLPSGTRAWFMNACSGDLTASSDYQELK